MKRCRQAGAALLAAMLTVTLVASFAAAALWQQWRSVEVEAAERTRVQASWILFGALDWARLILREDRNAFDHLGEPWAVPLQEARLSTFLAADPGNNAQAADADEVFLSGEIGDLQAKLDLHLLHTAGAPNPRGLQAFERLFDVLGLPQPQLTRLAENLRFAADLNAGNLSAAQAGLLPQRVEQLVWLGLPEETIAALAPYVTILPTGAGPQGLSVHVNVNTAPAEVLYAVAKPGVSLADAKRLVAQREQRPFEKLGDAVAVLPPNTGFEGNLAGVLSFYFEVRGRLRMGDVVIEERSVVMRTGRGTPVQTLQRERLPTQPQQAALRR